MAGISAEIIDIPGTGDTINPFPLDFNPLENLLPDAHHPNIATIPGSDEFLVRWYPFTQGEAAGADAARLEARMRRTEDHLAALASYGVGLPNRSHFIGRNPAGGFDDVIFTVVERLEGRKLEPTLDEHHAQAARAARAVLCLCSDALAHASPDFPYELAYAHQYTVTPAPTSDRPRVVVHDIEPRLEECPTDERRAVLIHQSLDRLSLWAPGTPELKSAQTSVRSQASTITPPRAQLLLKADR